MENYAFKSIEELDLDLESMLNSFSQDDITKLDTITDKLNRDISVYKDDNTQINEYIAKSYLIQMKMNREEILQYAANKLMDDVSKSYMCSKKILKNIKLKEKLDKYQNLE